MLWLTVVLHIAVLLCGVDLGQALLSNETSHCRQITTCEPCTPDEDVRVIYSTPAGQARPPLLPLSSARRVSGLCPYCGKP
jgi:hypothetical protein